MGRQLQLLKNLMVFKNTKKTAEKSYSVIFHLNFLLLIEYTKSIE
jgi:hypothetical protein